MSFRLLNVLANSPADAPLFRAENRFVTAGQVRAAAAGVADALSTGDGDLLLYTETVSAFAAGLLGAFAAGRNVVLPAHNGADYLQGLGDDLIFASDEPAELAKAIRIIVPDDAGADAVVTVGDDPYLQLTFFTSGSTAAPKAVVKTMRQLDDEADILAQVWDNNDCSLVLGTVPHHHIYGVLFRLFWPLRTATISMDCACAYWETAVAAMAGEQATLISSPAHLGRIPEGVESRPLRIFSSGGPLPFASAENAGGQLGAWPVEVLGSTETGGVGWRTQQGGSLNWRPLPEVGVTLSAAGEIQVRSPHADGDGVSTLGDLGDLLDDGCFRIRGRVGPVVKVEGVRVSLVRVEEKLTALGAVSSCRAVLTPAEQGCPARLGAVVQLTPQGRRLLADLGPFRLGRQLRSELAGDLSVGERPKSWRFVDDLPMNDQGKTTMAALTQLFEKAEPDAGDTILQDVDASDSEATARFRLDAGLKWFDGHFPGHPILPGIAQVHLAAAFAEQIWDWRPDGSNLMKLKFKRIVRPDAELSVHLRRDVEKGLLWFRMEWDGVVTSSGRIGGRG